MCQNQIIRPFTGLSHCPPCTPRAGSDPNPWVSSRVVYAFRRDVRFVRFAVGVYGSGHAGAPAVAPGPGSVPGGAVVGGDVVGGGYPARVVGRFCSLVRTTVSSPSSGGGRRVGARLVRVTRAGMWNSSRRIRATVRRARPRPSSMPVISWIQFEIAQASNAAHIHTVFTVRSPDGR